METVESCLFRQALLWNLSKATALKKTVSFSNLATRKTGRKMLMDIFPAASIFIFELKDILEQYRNCFEISEIELWIEMPYSPPKTAAHHQFWNVLNCLAAKKIVHNSFIWTCRTSRSKKRYLTEPKDDPFHFAIAFEEGLPQQRTIGQPDTLTNINEKPVYAATKKNENESCRCGAGDFRALNQNFVQDWTPSVISAA